MPLNEQEPEDPAPVGGDGYDAIIDRVMSPAAGAPAPAIGNPYDSIIDRYLGGDKATRRAGLDLSLRLSAGMDSGRAADALRLSQSSGIPDTDLYRMLGNDAKLKTKLEDKERAAQYDRLIEEAPSVARWADQPVRMAGVKGDLEKLASIEKILRARSTPGVMSDKEMEAAADAQAAKEADAEWELITKAAMPSAFSTKDEVKADRKRTILEQLKQDRSFTLGDGSLNVFERAGSAMRLGAKHGSRQVDLGHAGYRLMGGDNPAVRSQIEAIEKDLQATPSGSDFATNYLYPGAKIVGQMLSSASRTGNRVVEGATGGAAVALGAGIAGPQAALPEEIITLPAAMLTGAGVGLATGFAEQSYFQEAGHAYLELDAVRGPNGERIDEPTKVSAAVAIGLLNAGLETAGASLVAAPVKEAMKRLIKDGLKDGVITPSLKRALLRLGLNYGKAVGGEVATEAAQETVGILGGELAKMAQDGDFQTILNSPEARAEASERLVNVLSETIRGMAVVGLPGAAGNFVMDAKKALEVRRVKAEGVAQDIAKIGEAAANTQMGQERPRELENIITDATQGAGSEFVYIPVEKWTEHYSQQGVDPARKAEDVLGDRTAYEAAVRSGASLKIPTGKYVTRILPTDGQFFQDEVKLDPEEMSVREVKEEVEKAKAETKAKAKEKETSELDDAETQVREQVVKALQEAGFPREASAMGEVFGRSLRVVGDRLGMSATKALAELGGLKIERKETAPEVTAESLDQTRAESDAFKKWFGGSTVVDDSGSPKVVYHGTWRPGFTEFQGASYFTDSSEYAGQFAGASVGEGATYPVYLSIKNPLDLTDLGEAKIGWKAFSKRLMEKGVKSIPVEMLEVIQSIQSGPAWEYMRKLSELGRGFLKDNGFDGVIQKEGKKTAYITLDPNQIKSSSANSGAFDPNNPNIHLQTRPEEKGPPRGRLNIGSAGMSIDLFQAADKSTFLHEIGHFYLELLGNFAERPDAPEEVKADYKTALEALGVESRSALKKEQHEKWARMFEKYLMDGKAPSKALRRAFFRMKEWLTDIYRYVKNYFDGAEVTPAVRGVMDRLLASREEIEAASEEAGYQPLIKDPKALGLSEEWAAKYEEAISDAKQEAEETLTTELMRDIAAEDEAWWKTEREKLRTQVATEIDSKPEYVALSVLQKNKLPNGEKPPEALDGVKLSKKAIDSEWGADLRKDLPKGVVSEDGLQPGAVAELLGMTSADELLVKLSKIEPRDEAVDRITDERMRSTFGERRTPEDIHDAAKRALEGEARGKLLKMEMDAIASANLPALKGLLRTIAKRTPATAAIRKEAEQTISKEKAREIRPNVYQVAARRASKEALESALKGDWETAFAAKEREILNHELYRAAVAGRERVKKIQGYANDLDTTSTRERIGKAGGGFLEQMESLLERFDFRPMTNRAVDKRVKLREWIEQQEEAGIPIEIPDHIQEEAFRKSWKEMTLGELEEVYETLKHLEHQAGLKNRLLKNKAKRDLDEAVAEAATSVAMNSKGRRPRSLAPESGLKKGVSSFLAMHEKFAAIARQMDGWKDGGAIWGLLVRGMNEAGDREASMNAEGAEKLGKLYDLYNFKDRLEMRRAIFIPELGDSLSRERIISIALNWGNEDSRAKTLAGLSETYQKQITEDTIRNAVLSKLSAKDWEFVSGVWKLIDSYWPEIKALNERTMGIAPEKVEASPFQILTSDGKTVDVPGGYYPLKYDPEQTQRAAELDVKQLASDMSRGAAIRATTRHGHRKERVKGVRRPVRLDLGVITEHIAQVIHDISHFEYLIDANRLLRDERLQSVIRDHYGNTTLVEMRKALEDVAGSSQASQNAAERTMNYLRRGTTTAVLGFKASTALVQPLGVTQSIVRIGARWVGRGIAKWIGNAVRMEDTVRVVHEKSEMMRNRHRTQNREINEKRNELRASGKLMSIYDEAALWMTAKAQMAVDIPTWIGAYEKAMAEAKMEEGQTAADMDERAVALANQAVLDSQGGGQVKDLARVMRGSAFQKVFTMFMNYFITRLQLTRESFGKTKWTDPASIAKLGMDLLLLYPIPMVMGYMVKSWLRGDDDEPKEAVEKLSKDMLVDPLAPFIIFRELGSFVQGDGTYKGPAGTRAISETYDLLKQATQGEADEAFWRSLNDAAGTYFHYPSSQLDATIRGVNAALEGMGGIGTPLLGPPRK